MTGIRDSTLESREQLDETIEDLREDIRIMEEHPEVRAYNRGGLDKTGMNLTVIGLGLIALSKYISAPFHLRYFHNRLKALDELR